MSRQAFEVRWYRKYGKYPARIRREYGGTGDEYVIGDWSWHRADRPREEIEPRMEAAWLLRRQSTRLKI